MYEITFIDQNRLHPAAGFGGQIDLGCLHAAIAANKTRARA